MAFTPAKGDVAFGVNFGEGEDRQHGFVLFGSEDCGAGDVVANLSYGRWGDDHGECFGKGGRELKGVKAIKTVGEDQEEGKESGAGRVGGGDGRMGGVVAVVSWVLLLWILGAGVW